MIVKDLIPISTETIMGFEPDTGDLIFILDELQNAEVSQGQETQDITGKRGRKLGTIKRNKTVSVSATNGLVSGGLMSLQTGGDFSSEERAKITWVETVTVGSDHTALTSFKAVGAAGQEIITANIRNDDGTLGDLLEQADAADDGKFTYAPTTKTLTFDDGLAADTEIVVVYLREVKAAVLANDSDTYSRKVHLVVDQLAEDKCANVFRVQWDFPLADVSGEFSLSMGDNQTVHEFSADAVAGACGSAGRYFTYTVFGEKEGDPTT